MAVSSRGNRSTVKAVIGEEEIECQVNSAADFNLMREDVFIRIKGQHGVLELSMIRLSPEEQRGRSTAKGLAKKRYN